LLPLLFETVVQVTAAATKIKLFANILWCVAAATNTHFKCNTSLSSHSTHNWKVILGPAAN